MIDNVWSAADIAPFLLGGPNAVRVVTTRNARVCPAGALQLRLGPMSAGEVRELLHKTVPVLPREDTVKLAELCRGWPLLASVVGSTLGQDVAAGARPGQAAAEAGRALGAVGPAAFDVWDAESLSDRLRDHEDIVALFFGPVWTNRFFGRPGLLSSTDELAATEYRCERLSCRLMSHRTSSSVA